MLPLIIYPVARLQPRKLCSVKQNSGSVLCFIAEKIHHSFVMLDKNE